MLTLLSDENFNADIIRGLQRRIPAIDVLRVQEIGLASTPDPEILARAASEGRVLLTHDRETLLHFAYERVRAGQQYDSSWTGDRRPGARSAVPGS